MTDLETWPEVLRRWAEITSPEAVLQIVEKYGGLERVHIPKTPREDHEICRLIGFAHWAQICRAYGGERVDIPRGAFMRLRKAEIIDLANQGVAHREIALRTRTTQRYVRSVLGRERSRADARQMRLPFLDF